MKRTRHILQIAVLCIAMLMLVFDSKAALEGAQEGLALCGKTVIPSLFPFFVVSVLLTDALYSQEISILRPILRLCKMPQGAEGLLIVGLIGGYPVGAKCVYDCWKRGQISKAAAKRCLGFCSNAGPAFIFGMCGTLFSASWTVWALWGIHIVSSMVVGNLLPRYETSRVSPQHSTKITLSDAMRKAIAAMLSVCGWVVLFRVIISFAQRWFLWLMPTNCSVAVEGFLELANGCSSLSSVDSEGIRFVLCSTFLGLGGLCVGLQTISVTGELGTGLYFPGKALQGLISCCLATLIASLQFHLCSPAIPTIGLVVLALFALVKKRVDFHKRLVYNVENDWKGDFLCYSVRKLQNPAAIAPVEQK